MNIHLQKNKRRQRITQRLSIHRHSPWVSPYGFVSARVLEFKRINRFIRINLVHERPQIRKRSPKVNIYVLMIAAGGSRRIFRWNIHVETL